MLIYLFQEDLNLPIDFEESDHVIVIQNLKKIELQHTDLLSKERFGLSLSMLEIDQYNSHYNIWIDFLSREEAYCLIIENIEDFNNNKDYLKMDGNEIDDLEIIYPFNPFQDKQLSFDVTYSYGRRMGVAAYYINKTTARKLVEYTIIELPIDEFFLYLSEKEIVSISLLENELFCLKSDLAFSTDRNENKLKTILAINNWDNDEKKQALTILSYVFSIALQLAVPLFISDGTLLGFIRHGEIMGWDDDIDISAENINIQKLVCKIEADNIYRITEHLWRNNIIYYKVWHNLGNEISGYPYTFPFIDIWLFSSKDDSIKFCYKESIVNHIIFPLKDVLFYEIPVKIPHDPLIYLDKSIPDWRTSIQVYEWNHKTEKASNLMLQAFVETDSNGRLICK